MLEETGYRWLAIAIIFLNGFSLGRAVFSVKIKPHERLQTALMPVALTLIFIHNLIEIPTQVRWALLASSMGLILLAGALMTFRRPSDA